MINANIISINSRRQNSFGSSSPTPTVQATTDNLTESSVDVLATISTLHTIYLIVIANGATAPSASQIENGLDASDDPAIFAKYAIGTSVTIPVIELLPSTSYDIYLVGKDSEGTYTDVVLVEITTEAFDILTVSGALAYFEADDYNDTSDTWANRIAANVQYNLEPVAARNTPTKIAADINGHDVVNFVAASHQILQSDQVWDDLSTDATIYLIVKIDIYQAGVILTNYQTGAAYANTGAGFLSRTNGIRGTIRNSSGGAQNFDALTTDTASYHLVTLKTRDMGSSLSERVIKLDGAIQNQVYNINNMTAATNRIHLGSSFDSVSFDGKIAAILICNKRHGFVEERNINNFFKTRFGLSFTLQRDIDFQGLTAIDSTTGKEFNGLDVLRRSDNKFDLFASTVQGDVYRFTQTAVDTFTRTAMASGVGETQSLAYLEINGTGYIFLAHKVLNKISIRLADSPYTAEDLVTSRTEPQDFYLYDIDGDGHDEVIFSYQGATSADGGIGVLDFTGVDPLEPTDWDVTFHVHPAGWWIAGIFEFGGNTILAFSARNNNVNADQEPGHYYVAITDPGTASWAFGAETTMNNTVRDWLHLRRGDILGNGNNDLIGIALTTDAMLVHSGADLTTESTIALPEVKPGFNVCPIGDLWGDGRTALFVATQLSSGAGHYWIGRFYNAAWNWVALRPTNTHPNDNEVLLVDIYNEGKVRLIIDDSENVVDGHVYVMNVL